MKCCTRILAFLLAIVGHVSHAAETPPVGRVSFARDIRPILSDNCFRCHGPDSRSRQAELRLDERDSAVADRDGQAAIAPGDVAGSALMARVTAMDPDLRMPPADANRQLTPREIDLLREWIAQGAEYEGHWAFQPLCKPDPPLVAAAESLANPIDAFVSARLQQRGMSLAEPASPETLLRRVTLDLTGLPPPHDDLVALHRDLQQPDAAWQVCYERLVDRLLASPHFGEHLAVAWLDASRYADTNGYFGDKPRQMWLWRDWVIDALNASLPFDQFTVEQLAGDLLPHATVRQRIATGFNRNHMANNESGIIDEEFRTEYVVDRVHTTMTVWLGLSAGCAQCHDHKFDPISQREFYQLFAFFNNVPESGLIRTENPPPRLEVASAEQERELARLAGELREAKGAFDPLREELAAAIAAWEPDAPRVLSQPPDESLVFQESFAAGLAAGTTAVGTSFSYERGVRGQGARFDATRHGEAHLADFDPDGPWTIGLWMMPDGSLSCPLSLIEPAGERRGLEILYGKGLIKVHLVHHWGVSLIELATQKPLRDKTWHHVVVAHDGSRRAAGVRVYVDGQPARLEVRRDSLSGTIANGEPLRIGRRDSGLGYYGVLDELRIIRECVGEGAVRDWYWGERIRGILEDAPAERKEADTETLLDYCLTEWSARHPEREIAGRPVAAVRAARQRLLAVVRADQELRSSIPTVLVMEEMKAPRVTHVLERGQYDLPREVVTPGVPAAIAPWPDGAPRNRLGFAQWLTSEMNPLTPRVAANRLWSHCFGAGLVRTVEDFGAQGELPTHPELLDWLAATFRETGWDVKRLIRLMVTSRTYQQRSRFDTDGAQVLDPENHLLARGPSSRLSAEMIRDQALAVSGLLVHRVGGPSVKPYQPPGLWEAVSYNGEETYEADTGESLWRRSLYTYVKRQSPPPSLLTFDGPTREKCTMQRAATNTPLQALLLLNDDTYIEAARVLAARTLAADSEDDSRARYLWQSILLRYPAVDEIHLLAGLLARQRGRFAADPAAARRLLGVGTTAVDQAVDPIELAAWTVVAHTILNLDEAITRR